MRSRFLGLAALAGAVLLSPSAGVEACGPWFEPEVFVDQHAPDDIAAFASGQLGILQAGYDSNEYAVAYRYLNGGKLSDAERSAYVPQSSSGIDARRLNPDQVNDAQQQAKKDQLNKQPAQQWLATRAQYAPPLPPDTQKTAFPADYDGTIVFDESYLNCPNPAFTNAVLTLKNRASVWGKQSPQVIDWIRAQDAVFSNCAGKNASMPSPAASDSPALLRADRAYQAASAALYAKQFDEAARQFAAIALDTTSPWKDWGAYLAARATVRKAFAMGKATDPYGGELATYDSGTMRRAQQMLEALLAQPSPKPSRAAIESELNFIRIRTEPEQRAAEICASLAGPVPDPSFSQDLKDLDWILSKQIRIEHPAPLLAWIAAWRGANTSPTAYAAWQQSHALPWLAIALAKAAPSDSFAPALIDAAAQIAPGSPLYDTAFFHRVRLLTALHRGDEARALLDARLPAMRNAKPSSMLNAFLGERTALSLDFNEFLLYAPRTVLSSGSEAADNLQTQCNERAHAVNAPADCPGLEKSLQFDEDGVAVLNRYTPLATLIEAAQSPALPVNLRQNIAAVSWTRAVMLQDAASAAKLASLVPKAIRDTAGDSVDFPASLAILRNSGLRPYLEPGIPRVASFDTFDNFRDNWWCQPWNDRNATDQQNSPAPPAPTFVSETQKALAQGEYQRLQQLPDSVSLIGQRVLDYAQNHPDDIHVPEALALTVRASHYACQNWDPSATGDTKSKYTPVSKAAFQLLHSRYPKSPWTAKTPYYY
jgi:hypothetical protein